MFGKLTFAVSALLTTAGVLEAEAAAGEAPATLLMARKVVAKTEVKRIMEFAMSCVVLDLHSQIGFVLGSGKSCCEEGEHVKKREKRKLGAARTIFWSSFIGIGNITEGRDPSMGIKPRAFS